MSSNNPWGLLLASAMAVVTLNSDTLCPGQPIKIAYAVSVAVF